MSDPIASGDYARKQIFCPNAVVAWSHRRRFARAAQLASAHAGGSLLDYGCGDGTFIALNHRRFRRAVGTDADDEQLDDCRRRFGPLARVVFEPLRALASEQYTGAFDVVTCMEVLEHCTDAERVRVIEAVRRLCAPGGRIIISVPIEIGPALAAKQLFRALAAWRGQGDYRYRETYTPRELAKAVLGRPGLTRPEYVVQGHAGPRRYCGHKGFDWRTLQRELVARLRVERRLFSPMPLLGRVVNSQVWFVCAPKR